MIAATPIPGAYVIDIEPQDDERGFFARSVCRDEFAHQGLSANFIQQSLSWNKQRGILRGMHWQVAPWQEEKLVRVTEGAIYDVILDLRAESPTFKQWWAVELSTGNRRALYIPKDVAHGFQTLSETSEVLYQMTVSFHPECARTARWNDPAFAIAWPILPPLLSAKDSGAEDYC
ncbi:dTDP-4-dehydrorhamnose 3,5-epimerase [Gammaproteobacteria bacterium]